MLKALWTQFRSHCACQLYVFLGLFTFVYFLEAIGGSYMVSAVQNIERQFQIPSKLSGFLVSAHDITYVLTVIFISYYGSQGNRAKWIGFGTLLIALSQLLTASPNFIFPPKAPRLNMSEVESRLRPSSAIRTRNATLQELFAYSPIKDRIPEAIRDSVLVKLERVQKRDLEELPVLLADFPASNYSQKNAYSIDEPLIYEIFQEIKEVLEDQTHESTHLKSLLNMYAKNRELDSENDSKIIRRAATTAFAFCNQMINDLRVVIKHIKCREENSGIAPLLIIFVAMLIMGVGRTMPWSLGIPLIDDNVSKKQMPIYFGLINFFKILGPICGFLIGSFVNKLYYTFPAKSPRGLEPSDPTWIGAWWLGFLVVGTVKIVPSIALFLYPEEKPKSSVKQMMENGVSVSVTQKPKITLFDKHVKRDKTDFIKSYKEVLSSRVYNGVVMARILDVLAFKGYMISKRVLRLMLFTCFSNSFKVFLPKYLENHFGIPQYQTTLYMAAFGVVGFAGGVISGGFITRRLKLNGRTAALYVVAVSVFNTTLFLTKNFIGCHSVVNSVGVAGAKTNFNYTQPCNAECGCTDVQLYPVCDSTGQVFYSPCHAGCRHINELSRSEFEFDECTCAVGRKVSKASCHDDCQVVQYVFFLTIIIGAFVGGTGVVPGMLLLLRSVPPKTRSPALGLNGFAISLLGTLPSPILWGWVIDSTCLVWGNVCSSKGACQIYDPTRLRVRMHTLYAVIRMFSIVLDIYVAYHAKNINIQEDEEEAEEEAKKEAVQLNALPQ